MYNQSNDRKAAAYSKKLNAGKKRTYFFDVKPTKFEDYYLVITESRRKMEGDGFERSRIFIHKEDFNSFTNGLKDAIDFVKTELMPDFDFDKYIRETIDTNTTTSPSDDMPKSESNFVDNGDNGAEEKVESW